MLLRWAKDGYTTPVPEAANISVDEKTVTIGYSGKWGLLALVRQSAGAPADFDQLVDTTPNTLKLTIPTVVQGEGGTRSPVSQAKVFIRVTLLTADKKEPILLPVFPDRAPAWNRAGTNK